MKQTAIYARSPWMQRWHHRLVAWPPLIYLLLFFAAPTAIMIYASFAQPGDYGGFAPLWETDASGRHITLTLDSYTRLASGWMYLFLFIKSFAYASITTGLCLLIAYPLALTIARSPKKYRNLALLLVILPFWSNFLIRIYAWMIILGPQAALTKTINYVLGLLHLGPITLLFSPFAVLIGLVYVYLPFMVLPLYANLEKHDPELLNAAQDLGATPWRSFLYVTWPQSLPGVWAGVALVFIPALGAFAIPDILGGTNGIMIGNLISQEFLADRDWPFGAALSVVLTAAVLLMAALASQRGQVRRREHA